MFTGMDLTTNSSVGDDDVDLDWYMNKTLKSTTVKVLHSVDERVCRMRLMEDILRGYHMTNTVQPFFEVPAYRGICSAVNAAKHDCDSSCDHDSVSTVALTEADEDDDFGNMTLKEMHCLLQRNAGKLSKKQSCESFSSVPLTEAGLNVGNKVPVSETLPFIECSVQLGALELHLDSSTSNSAESGDDVSPRGVATSCHKPIDSMVVKCETLVREVFIPKSSIKKRKSMTGPCLSEAGISLEDDDCTLQMWQAHRRRLRGGKRSGCSAVEQASDMTKQISSESSFKPAYTLGVSSMNSAFDIADLGAPQLSTALCPSDGALLENPDSGSGSLSCPVVCEDLKMNSSLKPTHDAPAEDLSFDDGLDLKVKLQEMENEVNESKQGHSSLVCASPWACLWEGSPQKIGTERNPMSTRVSSWSLRPCDAITLSTSGCFKEDNSHRIIQEPLTSCEIVQHFDESAKRAGQSPAMEEPCTKTCNEACVDSTWIESNVIETAAIFSEPADNPIMSSSQKMRVKESFPAHCSEDSPSFAEPETGLDMEENRSQNMGMVCPLSSEEISGSPVSLFSTERLDVEEEQELQQIKPSKIPCKRKAISPLSRERLLQASKCGFKKLPRAFKGFIGRDTPNHESFNACTKFRKTDIMESSPADRLLEKEEALPGSPCHIRKKFLPAKPFPPKASLPSSYGDSCAATAMASSVQASLPSPSCVQRLSLILNNSPSPPLQQNPKPINGKSPTTLSPSIPTKGILRSSPSVCQGACKCEECASLRFRAERAAEFSQCQMHDIEGLAVRLLKELNAMRCVLEESLIQRTAPRVESPPSALSPEKVRRAANNALATEKMAKSWLVRMARDCNRFCKIMRMQERKLTFADESGGQLCHVKLFHSQPKLQQDGVPLNAVKETIATSSLGKEDSSCSEPEADMQSK